MFSRGIHFGNVDRPHSRVLVLQTMMPPFASLGSALFSAPASRDELRVSKHESLCRVRKLNRSGTLSSLKWVQSAKRCSSSHENSAATSSPTWYLGQLRMGSNSFGPGRPSSFPLARFHRLCLLHDVDPQQQNRLSSMHLPVLRAWFHTGPMTWSPKPPPRPLYQARRWLSCNLWEILSIICAVGFSDSIQIKEESSYLLCSV